MCDSTRPRYLLHSSKNGYEENATIIFTYCLYENTDLKFSFVRAIGVGIATGYGLNNRGVGVRVPAGSKIFYSHVVQTDSGAYPTSNSMDTGGAFPGFKLAGTCR
jgi:hypothetical protein